MQCRRDVLLIERHNIQRKCHNISDRVLQLFRYRVQFLPEIMENVFNLPKNELVNLKDALISFRNELRFRDSKRLPSNEDDIMKLLGIDDPDVFAKLKASVDLDVHLSDPSDVPVLPFKASNLNNQVRQPIVEVPKETMHLNTFREVVKSKKKYYGNALGPSVYIYRYPEEPPVSETPDIKPYEDFLMSIRVYQPYHSAHIGALAKPRFSEEFLVRGEQYLSELRDRISCDCKLPMFDVSESPFQKIPEASSNPGFFFITDTFYNDTRDPKNCDYSEVMLKWAESRPSGTFTSKFKTAKMEETKFIDLQVRLGFPQVYQHFGNCEHVFVFSWIRMLSPDDHLSSKEYPILKSMDLCNKHKCGACGQRDTQFIVRNSDRHMHDPVNLCRICLNSFHYEDGKKLGEFSLYRLYEEANEETLVLSSDEDSDD